MIRKLSNWLLLISDSLFFTNPVKKLHCFWLQILQISRNTLRLLVLPLLSGCLGLGNDLRVFDFQKLPIRGLQKWHAATLLAFVYRRIRRVGETKFEIRNPLSWGIAKLDLQENALRKLCHKKEPRLCFSLSNRPIGEIAMLWFSKENQCKRGSAAPLFWIIVSIFIF